MNFLPAGPTDGGLILVPRSQMIFNKIFQTRPQLTGKGDFVKLYEDRQFWENEYKEANLEVIKLCCEPGDFVLWDSRVVHCNCSASEPRALPTDGSFLPPRRLVTYVCMTPASRLTPESVKARIAAFTEGQTTSHWPEDCLVHEHRRNSRSDYTPPQLTPEQKILIPM